MKQYVRNFFESILQNRQFYMGVAMIMVVAYHSMDVCPNKLIAALLYPGFLGVDIFLLLSGYGMSHSFVKNALPMFYKHRVSRLIPSFLMLMISVTMLDAFLDVHPFSIAALFANVTSLSFWGVGGPVIEWYLCFLIYLCICFPLIAKLINREWGGVFFGYANCYNNTIIVGAALLAV